MAHPLRSTKELYDESYKKTALIFSLADKVGALEEALKIFADHKINLTRIESRPSQTTDSYDFFIDLEAATDEHVEACVSALTGAGASVTKLSATASASGVAQNVPWFPRVMSDLDSYADKVLDAGSDLEADHPGFKDEVYRQRRKEIVDLAKKYKFGEKIERIQYTEAEIETWAAVYRQLKALYPTHACKEHNNVFPLLEQFCGYSERNIPQLQDISEFLQRTTGWRLKPVMGLLSSRDFLNGLAFRVFHSTQYIRHHSKPNYTPEPDVCHELLGHVPLFADPDFAQFSHAIGLASLGVSDAEIERLATCYWFTVEFGLCKQDGKFKAYGAGLLSSFGELEYCLSGKPEVKPFDPHVTGVTKYPITEYQPTYFFTENFKAAGQQMLDFAASLDRPFEVRYNPYTLSVEILDSKEKVASYVQSISSELNNVVKALGKLRK